MFNSKKLIEELVEEATMFDIETPLLDLVVPRDVLFSSDLSRYDLQDLYNMKHNSYNLRFDDKKNNEEIDLFVRRDETEEIDSYDVAIVKNGEMMKTYSAMFTNEVGYNSYRFGMLNQNGLYMMETIRDNNGIYYSKCRYYDRDTALIIGTGILNQSLIDSLEGCQIFPDAGENVKINGTLEDVISYFDYKCEEELGEKSKRELIIN